MTQALILAFALRAFDKSEDLKCSQCSQPLEIWMISDKAKEGSLRNNLHKAQKRAFKIKLFHSRQQGHPLISKFCTGKGEKKIFLKVYKYKLALMCEFFLLN